MSRAARLGVFIVATLAILVAGIFIIGGKQYLFRTTYQLRSQFADVVVDLDPATHEIVKRDSVASIETEGLLGNQYLAISVGTAGAGEVKSGDTIASRPPLEMADLLQKTSGILDSSQAAIDNATKATEHLSSISAKIDAGQGTVGALVNDKALYNNLAQTTQGLDETMVAAQAGVTDFAENMEALKHNFFVRGYYKNRGYEDSAELTRYEIGKLPQAAPVKEFTYSAKRLFQKQDTAKLKNQKSLKDSGQFLADNQFGLAVIAVSAGPEGDAQKDLTLTEARAMVVREYLVENFGFDDAQVKTLGMGKGTDGKGDQGDDSWGTVRVLIYPAGTEVPAGKGNNAPAGDSSK
jgi:phospholipid/cholesterol/gamma-HCH transport system substrate-binding protein